MLIKKNDNKRDNILHNDVEATTKAHSHQGKLSARLPAFVFCLLFFVCCALPLAAAASGYETPNLEKRTLAPKPALIENDEINMRYTNQFDDWFGDTFPFRSYLISGWHILNRKIPNNSFSDRVIAGSDDWLFFSETLDDYLRFEPLSQLELARLKTIIDMQAAWLNDQEIAYIFTVAPNKNSIYPQYMPARYEPATNPDKASQLSSLGISAYVDLFDLLRMQAALASGPTSEEFEDYGLIYHKSDSHWNNSGALLAAEQLLISAEQKMQTSLSIDNLPGPPIEYKEDWQGDLSVMLFPSSPKPDLQHHYSENASYRYKRPIRSLEDMKILADGSGDSHKLLMFRDSFANALIPLLSPVFDEALYSRAMPADYRLIAEINPDLIILEIVERNLRNLLETAPIMPARPCSDSIDEIMNADDNSAANLEKIDINWLIAEEGDYLRLGAIIPDENFQDAIRVVIELGSETTYNDKSADLSYYEAFPIIDRNLQEKEAAQDETSGFTITLDQETAAKWQEAELLKLHFFDGQDWTSFYTKY